MSEELKVDHEEVKQTKSKSDGETDPHSLSKIGYGAFSDVFSKGGKAIKIHREFHSFAREYLFHCYLDGIIKHEEELRSRDSTIKATIDKKSEFPIQGPSDTTHWPGEFRDRIVEVEKVVAGNGYGLRMKKYEYDLERLIRFGIFRRSKNEDGEDVRETVIFDILGGLYCLHSFGIVHGDLSPSNILANLNPFNIYIGDLGSAFMMGSISMKTTTYLYASDDKIITPAHDMYSLGVIIASLWNYQPWFNYRQIREDDGSVVTERPAWAKTIDNWGGSEKLVIPEILVFPRDGGKFAEPKNPKWREATKINAGGINIGGLPRKWQDVVIALLSPKSSRRPTSSELLQSVFGMKLETEISISGRRPKYIPQGKRTIHLHDTENPKLIRELCKPYEINDVDVRHIMNAASKYAETKIGKSEHGYIDVSNDELRILAFIRVLSRDTDPSIGKHKFPYQSLASVVKGSTMKKDVSRIISNFDVLLDTLWMS